MRALLLALFLLPLPAVAARVAGEEPASPERIAPPAPGARTVLPAGEGCRGSTELTNTYAALRPAVTACFGATPPTAPLRLDVSPDGTVAVRIGDPTLDTCLAAATAPALGRAACTLRTTWPRWADPRTLPEPTPPPFVDDNAARSSAAAAVLDTASDAVRACAETQGAPRGAWVVDLTVGEDGRVRTAAVTGEPVRAELDACLLEATWPLRFAPARPELVLRKTYRFQ